MRRLSALSIALFLILASCKTGPLKDIRLGKSFAVMDPGRIVIYTKPDLKSETFHLEEAEEFVVEDVTCADGLNTFGCYFDLTTAPANPGIVKIVFYKVRFESGKEGYVNAANFYPKLVTGLISEKGAAVNGLTPKEEAANFRKEMRDLKAELKEQEASRQTVIDASPWTEEDKQLIRERNVRIGMTKFQVSISQAHSAHLVKKITETMTEKGMMEEWVYDDIVFYFEDGKLAKWRTVDNNPEGHIKKAFDEEMEMRKRERGKR